jgi:transcriptional regulator with XRE-family HTH domain
MSTISLVERKCGHKVKLFFIYMNYGERLKSVRKARGLTQEQLAEKVSAAGHTVSSSYVSMIERIYEKRLDGLPTRPARRFVELAAKILDDDINEALMDADYAPLDRERFRQDDGMFSGWDKVPEHLRPLARKQVQAIIESLIDNEDNDTDYIDDAGH